MPFRDVTQVNHAAMPRLGVELLRDVTGLVIKGLIYGLMAAVFACHEGLRDAGAPNRHPDAVAWSAFRAVVLAFLAILVVSSGWFLVFYHAGPAFGPTLLAPQGSLSGTNRN